MEIKSRPGESDEEFARRLQHMQSSSPSDQRISQRRGPMGAGASQQSAAGVSQYQQQTESQRQLQRQPSQSAPPSSGEVTCADRMLNCMSLWGLHFINIVDLIVGTDFVFPFHHAFLSVKKPFSI